MSMPALNPLPSAVRMMQRTSSRRPKAFELLTDLPGVTHGQRVDGRVVHGDDRDAVASTVVVMVMLAPWWSKWRLAVVEADVDERG